MSRLVSATVMVATMLVARSAPAQQQPVATGSSVAGVVYLITPDGERREAVGRTVSLVRDSDALRARLAEACRSHERQTRIAMDSIERINKEVGDTMQAPREDPWTAYWGHETSIRNARIAARRQLAASSRRTIRGVLAKAAVDSATTGADASFRFEAMQAGRYILYSESTSGPLVHQWWLPIDLPGETERTHPLVSSMAVADQLPCGYR
jgi:hypothetical protein